MLRPQMLLEHRQKGLLSSQVLIKVAWFLVSPKLKLQLLQGKAQNLSAL